MTSIFPHWGHPAAPDNAGVTTRHDAWQWIFYEIREENGRSAWLHAGFIDAIHYISMEVLREVAHCENPLYISRRVAGAHIQLHHVVVSRHMEHRVWTLGLQYHADQKMQDYHQAASRSIDDEHRRLVRLWADPKAATEDEVKLADGTILDPLWWDDTVHEEPQWPAPRRPRICSKGFTAPSPENNGDLPARPNTRTPERPRAMDKEGETSQILRVMEKHRKSSARRPPSPEKPPPRTSSCRPRYSDLYGLDSRNPLLPYKVFSDMHFARLPDIHTFARTPNVDPMSRALNASGAQAVAARKSRLCGEIGVLETPPVSTPH